MRSNLAALKHLVHTAWENQNADLGGPGTVAQSRPQTAYFRDITNGSVQPTNCPNFAEEIIRSVQPPKGARSDWLRKLDRPPQSIKTLFPAQRRMVLYLVPFFLTLEVWHSGNELVETIRNEFAQFSQNEQCHDAR